MKPEGSFSVIEALGILGLKRYEFNYLVGVMGLTRPVVKGKGRGTRTFLSRVNLYELGVIQKLVSFGIPTSTIKQIEQTRIGPLQKDDPSLIKTGPGLKVTDLKSCQIIRRPTNRGKHPWPRLLEWAVSEQAEGTEVVRWRYLIMTSDPDFRFFVEPDWIGKQPLSFFLSSFSRKLTPILILDLALVLEEVNAKIESKA